MITATRKSKKSFNNFVLFLWARIRRIYPMYWFATGVQLILAMSGAIMLFGAIPFDDLPRHLLLLPPSGRPFLDVGWSLIFEMYFYIVFALLFFFVPGRLLYWLAAWIGAVAVISTLLTPAAHWLLQLMFSPFCFTFFCGTLAGMAPVRLGWNMAVLLSGAALALTAVLLALIYLDPGFLANGTWSRSLALGICFATLVYGVVNIEHHNGLWVPTFLIRLGDASYTLYLIHMPLILLVGSIWYAIAPGLFGLDVLRDSLWDNLFLILVAGLLSVSSTLWLHVHVEQPLLRLSRDPGRLILGRWRETR